MFSRFFGGIITVTDFIIKKFIDKKGLGAREKRLRFGTVGGACGIAVNVLLALSKAAAGLIFHSIALVADAANNMTDAASSIITLIGFKLSGKKPDSEHPYGHGRVEYISGLIMSFIVLLLGLSLVKSSVQRILAPEPSEFSWLTITVLIVSICAKLWLSVFYKKFQKLTGSATFAAASADSRNDVITTLAVLLSTVIYAVSEFNIDGYTGAIVSVFIIISGIGLIRETLDPLLGQPPEKELVEEIYSRTMSHRGVIGIHDLVVHNYGPGRIFASLHAEVPANADMLESHDMIDNIEQEFKNEMGLEMVIHIDPVITDDPYVSHLKSEMISVINRIDNRLTLHDFRVVKGPTHANVIFDVVVPRDMGFTDKELKEKIDEMFRINNDNCNTVITFDRSYIG